MNPTFGVIGCGGIARFHFSGLEQAGAQVKYVCDLNPETAQPWAQKFNAIYTADYQQILRDPEVDAVTVATFSRSHKKICLDAIAAGKAVICEKTLAENADDAVEIIQAATQAGTIFYTSYMKRFIPAVEEAKKLLPSLGRIFSTTIRAFQPWGDHWTPGTEGFQSDSFRPSLVVDKYGGGILVCGGSHILDLTCFLLGRPSRVYATMHTPEGRDYDVQAAALLETQNGIVHYEALAHPLTRIGFLRDGWEEEVQITGMNGRLHIYSSMWDQPEHKASMLVHFNNATGVATEYRYPPESPFNRAVAFFCANIARGEQGEQARTTGYDVDELTAHIKKSAATRQAVDVQYRI